MFVLVSITARLLLLRPACAVTLKAARRGDRGLKAINNLMLSGLLLEEEDAAVRTGPRPETDDGALQ